MPPSFFPPQALIEDYKVPEIESSREIDSEFAFSATDLKRVMNLLPVESRTLFSLYLKGYRYEEIAERMKMPLGTVKVRIFRIKRKLRSYGKQIV